MKGSCLGLVVVALAVIAWNSGIVNSAIVPNGGKPLKQSDPYTPLKFIENTMVDYVELAEAYYAPAPNDTIREKRTLAVVRNLVNRTRSGFTAVRGLLRGNSGSSSGGGSQTFLARVGDLFTRLLTFFTRLWDRITGFFNRGGESGSSGTGPFARIRTGLSGVFARLTGGGGGGGGLGALFGRTSTTEGYSEFVYSTEKTTSTTEKAEESDFPADSENDFPFHDNTKAADATAESNREGKSKDTSSSSSDKAAEVSGGYPDFIPFPGESDSDIATRSAKNAPSSSQIIPANLPIQRVDRQTRPYVVHSPDVLHLINGQRLVVVE